MIDKKRTIKEFGYDPNYLKPKSHKKIWCVCDNCNKSRLLSYSDYTDICFLCARKKYTRKGHKQTEETKLKISKGNKGKKNPMSEETKEKISKSLMGHKRSEDSIKKQFESKKGYKHTEETKEKMSKSQMGRECTQETREKISKSNKGRKLSEEQKENISKGHKGKNLNPNITNKERVEKRKYFEYGEWRKEVYKRDNYTCQICNSKTSGDLIAHHMESYNSNIELRTIVNNGITMCKKCHKDFHHIFGYGNNDKKQLKEFIKIQGEK